MDEVEVSSPHEDLRVLINSVQYANGTLPAICIQPTCGAVISIATLLEILDLLSTMLCSCLRVMFCTQLRTNDFKEFFCFIRK